MQLLDANKVITAILTPQSGDGGIDGKRLKALSTWTLTNGCDGIALFGTTGEASSFSVEERKLGLSQLIDDGIDPSRLIVGTGCPSVMDTAELSKHATCMGVAGILVIPPYFFKGVEDTGLRNYYVRLVELVDEPALKVLLYHFPEMAGVGVSLELARDLHEALPGVFVGIKDSSGNLDAIINAIDKLPNFLVFTGDDDLLAAVLRAGGAGSISAGANLFPSLLHVIRSDPELKTEEAKAAQRIVSTLWSETLLKLPVTEALKELFALATGNQEWLSMRPPLVRINDAQRKRLLSQLERTEFTLDPEFISELADI